MSQPSFSDENAPSGRLRVLETTDLHMQVLDYDYFADQTDSNVGLIGLVDQIAALQNEPGVSTILCDNGDLIQGNPLADDLAANPANDAPHPIIAALNMLRYDAVTLGNHEFDYGLDFLRATYAKLDCPVVSANITCTEGPALAAPFTILERRILCDDGTARKIRLGITGFGPPQIADWRDQGADSPLRVDDFVDAARRVVPQMRAAGADLIIALCHTGLGPAEHVQRMENAALPLAALDGIDVLLTGHTHESFPDPAGSNTADTDYGKGTLYGKPVVMAEFCGQSLGVIDLTLQWQGGRWCIADHDVRLEKATSGPPVESPLRQQLRALMAKPHAATIRRMQQPIARTAIPITSYFATIQPDLSQQLLARAMQDSITAALRDTEYGALPILAAKSSFRFGGRSGLGHYIDIPKGPITLRDAAAIFPFADMVCAVRRTGKQIRLWLERSAAHYNQMQPGRHDQALINLQSAGYNFDTISGLSYQFDLSQPARFCPRGDEVNPAAARVAELTYQGAAVRDTDVFIVATNSFRAKGGGGFPQMTADDIVFTSSQTVCDVLVAYLAKLGTVAKPVQPTWSFAPIPQTSATFLSAPQALDHLTGPVSHVGPGPHGFETYRISF